MKPIITVITPCYGQAQYLEECAESVLAQTFKDWSMIIVNDYSPDNTEEVAKKLSKKDSRISYISHSKNLGLSAARNTGIFAAKTPYVLPLDADDKIATTCLEKMLEAIEDGFGDQIYSDVQEFGDNHRYIAMYEYCYERIRTMNHMVCCTLYRKEHWQEVGGYDEKMNLGFEDWEFNIRMGDAGHYGYRIPEPLFYYRIKKNSMIVKARERRDEIIRYMRNKDEKR